MTLHMRDLFDRPAEAVAVTRLTSTIPGEAPSSRSPGADETLTSRVSSLEPPAALAGCGSEEAARGISAASGAASSLSFSAGIAAAEHALLIECCRKLMTLAVAPDLDAPARRRVLSGIKRAWKREISAALHPKLASMFLSAEAIIDGRANRAHAIVEFADWLGCAPKAIGGAA
jgi:hypothetical protein